MFESVLLHICLTLSIALYPSLASAGHEHGHKDSDHRKPLILSELIKEALEKNPMLRTAKHNSLAKEADISPAGAWDDPKVEYAWLNYPKDSYKTGQSAMTGRELRLKQKIPFPGKMGKKENAAEAKYYQSKEQYQKTKLDLVRQVKAVYYELFVIHEKIKLTKKNIGSLVQLEKSALSKYKVGKGILQDVAKARVEKAESELLLMELKQNLLVREGDLNILLNRDAHDPLGRPEKFSKTSLSFKRYSMQSLSDIAVRNDPYLKSINYAVQSAEEELSFSKWNYLPDFEIGVAYRFREPNPIDDGQDYVSASIGINLPLYVFSKQNEQRKSASQKLMASEANRTMTLRHLSHAIHHLYGKAEKASNQIDLYEKELIPSAEKALASSQSAYKVNKVEFLTVINNQKTLFNHKMKHLEVLAEYETALASLETRLGMPINQIDGYKANKGKIENE